MSAIEAYTAWNSGTPWIFLNHQSNYTYLALFLLFSFYVNTFIKYKKIMWGKIYVIHWGSYGLKQGNLLQKFQITNQIILFLFDILWFSFYTKKYIKGKKVFNVTEKICWPLRKLRPETGESLILFSIFSINI